MYILNMFRDLADSRIAKKGFYLKLKHVNRVKKMVKIVTIDEIVKEYNDEIEK